MGIEVLPTIADDMKMNPKSQFLSALPPTARDAIQRELSEVTLRTGEVIVRAYSKIETAYFPVDAVFVVEAESTNDAPFCIGLIGADGLLGAGMSLDDRVCVHGVRVLAGGRALALPMARLRDLLLGLPEFRKRALAYDHFFLAQAQQTALCSGLHELTNRLSSWLLRMQVYAGDDLSLTQDKLSEMLGVRRTSITQRAVELQQIGAIEYRRGNIKIVNMKKLRKGACLCHSEVTAHYARIFDVSFDGD